MTLVGGLVLPVRHAGDHWMAEPDMFMIATRAPAQAVLHNVANELRHGCAIAADNGHVFLNALRSVPLAVPHWTVANDKEEQRVFPFVLQRHCVSEWVHQPTFREICVRPINWIQVRSFATTICLKFISRPHRRHSRYDKQPSWGQSLLASMAPRCTNKDV